LDEFVAGSELKQQTSLPELKPAGPPTSKECCI